MKVNQKRDQLILQMREQDIPRLEIARKFGLTSGRIALIERQGVAEKSQADRRARLQAEIRNADNLDKSWAIVDLIDAMWLIVIARVRLLAHFEKAQITRMSLRGLMNLPISETDDAEPGQVSTPLLRIRGLGKYGSEV